MTKEHITIEKTKQSFAWNYLSVLFSNIYDNWSDYDKELEKLLGELLKFAEDKIKLADDTRDITDRYVVVEYEKYCDSKKN